MKEQERGEQAIRASWMEVKRWYDYVIQFDAVA
jgi:hypothetical protein